MAFFDADKRYAKPRIISRERRCAGRPKSADVTITAVYCDAVQASSCADGDLCDSRLVIRTACVLLVCHWSVSAKWSAFTSSPFVVCFHVRSMCL